MLARFIIINNIATWFLPIMYNVNMYINTKTYTVLDFEVSLQLGNRNFKSQQEPVRISCHSTFSTGTAAHPEQNMYSPFCHRIFREAFNNSSMPTVAGLYV